MFPRPVAASMMPPPNRVIKRPKSRITKAAKKSNIDIALEAVRAELKRDYPLYEEALLGVLRAKAAGGSATPWLSHMSDLVRGKPLAEMSHEGVKFLIEEQVRTVVVNGHLVPRP